MGSIRIGRTRDLLSGNSVNWPKLNYHNHHHHHELKKFYKVFLWRCENKTEMTSRHWWNENCSRKKLDIKLRTAETKEIDWKGAMWIQKNDNIIISSKNNSNNNNDTDYSERESYWENCAQNMFLGPILVITLLKWMREWIKYLIDFIDEREREWKKTKEAKLNLLTDFLHWFWIRPLRLTFRIQLGQYEYEVVVKIAVFAQLFQFLQ